MIKAIIIDTETTGVSKSDQVIELAWIGLPELHELASPAYATPIEKQYEQRFKPQVMINPAAYAVHKISMKDLVNCSPSSKALHGIYPEVPSDVYWIGHKVDFDRRMIAQSASKELDHIKLICTHSLATKLLPSDVKEALPDMKLATICKYFYPDFLDAVAEESHSAMGDCTLVLMLLDILLKHTRALTWSDLHQTLGTSAKPVKKTGETKPKILSHWPPFGKHKGVPFNQIPREYLVWARDNMDFTKNQSLLHTILYYLT